MPNKMKKIISALLILAAASTSFANDIAKYKDSADKGNPQSQLALGILYMTGKGGATQNPALALEYIKKAADSNLAAAQTYLGCIYAEGKIVPRDMQLAVQWRELGAQNGNVNDKWSLGNAYLYGYLVPKDQLKAVFWISQAAELDHVEAINKLIEIYTNLKNEEEVAKWKEKYSQLELKAAAGGNVDAMLSVAKQYQKGSGGLAKDKVQMIYWYRRAAEGGNIEAMERVAKFYATGRFLPKNHKKALSYYEKIAEADSAYCFKISGFYSNGSNGFPEDSQKAIEWLEKGAEKADDSTKLYVAWRYWAGFEVAKNATRSLYWCGKVLENTPKDKTSKEIVLTGAWGVAKRMINDISNNVEPPKNFGAYYNSK